MLHCLYSLQLLLHYVMCCTPYYTLTFYKLISAIYSSLAEKRYDCAHYQSCWLTHPVQCHACGRVHPSPLRVHVPRNTRPVWMHHLDNVHSLSAQTPQRPLSVRVPHLCHARREGDLGRCSEGALGTIV